jgi:hypothetical protein
VTAAERRRHDAAVRERDVRVRERDGMSWGQAMSLIKHSRHDETSPNPNPDPNARTRAGLKSREDGGGGEEWGDGVAAARARGAGPDGVGVGGQQGGGIPAQDAQGGVGSGSLRPAGSWKEANDGREPWACNGREGNGKRDGDGDGDVDGDGDGGRSDSAVERAGPLKGHLSARDARKLALVRGLPSPSIPSPQPHTLLPPLSHPRVPSL